MNLLATRRGRLTLFTVLYASEGGPIGFIWWALPAMLRARGAPVESITALTAALVLPWSLKFLWAPLVDSLRGPRAGFRAWIMGAQVLMGLTLLPLLRLDPAEDFRLVALLLFAHALAAATQDVAVDALAVATTASGERGTLNGAMQAGMLLGRSLFGGGALLLSSRLGWPWVLAGLLVCIWCSLVLLLFVREPARPAASGDGGEEAGPETAGLPAAGRAASFAGLLGSALRRPVTWGGLAFALVSAAAFEATGALAGPFLIDRGVSQESIGLFFGLPVVIVTIAGGLAGGRISDRIGRRPAVGLFLCGFVASVAALGAVDRLGAGPGALLWILGAMYLFIGLFTASSYALFMDLTDPRLGATQFSAYMAATNGCEAWSGWAGGRIAGAAGYPAAFLAMSAVSILSLPLLAALRAPGVSSGRTAR